VLHLVDDQGDTMEIPVVRDLPQSRSHVDLLAYVAVALLVLWSLTCVTFVAVLAIT